MPNTTPLAPVQSHSNLAGRGARFVAFLIDAILVGSPLYYFYTQLTLDGSDPTAAIRQSGVITGFIVAFLAVIQIVLLTRNGQTIGKKIMGIKIVKQDTGQNGGFVTNVLLRSFVNSLIGSIPFVGILYAVIDGLFIFSEDRRCVHDKIAGTIVVNA